MKNTAVLLMCMICTLQTFAQQQYDIIINEIMANPSSAPALPAAKYIELYNTSDQQINLLGWTLSDGSSTAVVRTNIILAPDSFIVISSSSGASLLSPYTKVISVTNFLTLRVNGDIISLRSSDGKLIHAVAYDRSWYGNEVKSAEGWSLEMIDARNPCSGQTNWKASTDRKGGTPGYSNSIAAENTDTEPPGIVRVFPTDSLRLIVTFNEPLDSSVAAKETHYILDDNTIDVMQAEPQAPFFNKIRLMLNSKLSPQKTYNLTIRNITDCSGNRTTAATVKTALSFMSNPNDIVINEVLFNAPDDGDEYIELYNHSNYSINLKELFIATRNSAGNLNTLRRLSEEDALCFPGDYKVLSGNVDIIKRKYIVKDENALIQVTSMPALANTSGTIVLLNVQGDIIDELEYNENWHFPLISNNKGVSLERINDKGPTQDKSNWHSAAASAGYGTPGYQNSQVMPNELVKGEIKIDPYVFSPDGDGHNDFLMINYTFPTAGYVCNITAFDGAGRPVKYIVRNGLCGTSGFFKWDGLNEKNQRLPMGIYIVYIEIFNLQGKTKHLKQAVTLARRMN